MRTKVLPSPPPLTTPHFRGPDWKDDTSWEALLTDFCPRKVLDSPLFHISIASPLPASAVPSLSCPLLTMSRVELSDWDEIPYMRTTVLPSPPPLTTPHFRGPTWKDDTSWETLLTDFYPGKVLDALPFHISITSTLPAPTVSPLSNPPPTMSGVELSD